jgi:hypothetical protein
MNAGTCAVALTTLGSFGTRLQSVTFAGSALGQRTLRIFLEPSREERAVAPGVGATLSRNRFWSVKTLSVTFAGSALGQRRDDYFLRCALRSVHERDVCLHTRVHLMQGGFQVAATCDACGGAGMSVPRGSECSPTA